MEAFSTQDGSYPTSLVGALAIKATPDSQGFFILSPDGAVHGYGDAVALGNAKLPHRAVSLAVTHTGHGYWVFDANGCTQAFGDAQQFTQSICGTPLNGPILDAATTPTGKGYWLVASDGGMFAFGDARFLGSMGGRPLNKPVVGMASSPNGTGYWEVAADGGIFAFNVPFLGSMGGKPLNRPVAGMVASGAGYMMVAADGGIFNFGNPFFGSLGANPPANPIVATAPSVDGSGRPNGYWMLDSSGLVHGFGSAWLPAAAPPAGVFATSVSANHRYLLDQNGAPYMVVGDSPQALIANLSTADANVYFADRQGHGVNAVWVNLVCQTDHCRSDGSTWDGIVPFTSPGDLSTPNPAYFARVDAMVSLAASHGITVFLDPMETSTWLGVLRANGTAKATAYGTYLGNRYKAMPNVVWQSGNDFQSWANAADDAVVLAVANGIKAAGDAHLQTIELNYYRSLSSDDPNWAALVDLDGAYTYYPTYDEVLAGYNRSPARPVFFVEGHYEGETLGPNGGETGTPSLLRRQEYWTMLAGATGQLYGTNWWKFQSGWQANLDSPGMVQLGLLAGLFAPRAWSALVPDQGHSLLSAGYGTYSGSAKIAGNDYATAALTGDGSLGLVYVPTNRTLTVQLSKLRGPVTAQWFDPTNGTYATIAGSPLANNASHQFTPPATNSAGDADWVLVLQS